MLGTYQLTAYRSVRNQTDATPFHTATGERCHPYGVAVSQDLLKKNGGPLDYGDWIYIDEVGLKVVNDCMNIRHRKSIDVWVDSADDEHKFFQKFRNGRRQVWIIKIKKSQ
jgi:3D (Asp-Asp-Asp) domain-containing protein